MKQSNKSKIFLIPLSVTLFLIFSLSITSATWNPLGTNLPQNGQGNLKLISYNFYSATYSLSWNTKGSWNLPCAGDSLGFTYNFGLKSKINNPRILNQTIGIPIRDANILSYPTIMWKNYPLGHPISPKNISGNYSNLKVNGIKSWWGGCMNVYTRHWINITYKNPSLSCYSFNGDLSCNVKVSLSGYEGENNVPSTFIGDSKGSALLKFHTSFNWDLFMSYFGFLTIFLFFVYLVFLLVNYLQKI